MAEYKAPEDTSSITLSTQREFRVNSKGVIQTPDDLSESELAQLAREGFVLVEPAAAKAPTAVDKG